MLAANPSEPAARPNRAAPLTLPDLLRDALDIVFVGINPSVYAAEHGHYFARPTNRFWPSFSRSVLGRSACARLGVSLLRPADDAALLDDGIGFTDVVKRATPRASDLAPGELRAGVAALVAKLERVRPRVVCFHGVTGYVHVQRELTTTLGRPQLGPQELRLGSTRIYLVPNPSGANAHVTPAEQTRWYDRLAAYAALGRVPS